MINLSDLDKSFYMFLLAAARARKFPPRRCAAEFGWNVNTINVYCHYAKKNEIKEIINLINEMGYEDDLTYKGIETLYHTVARLIIYMSKKQIEDKINGLNNE